MRRDLSDRFDATACIVSQLLVPQLPPLTECSHHVNLTNGIELIPVLDDLGLSYRQAAVTGCAL